MAAQTRPEPMNASPHHSKVKVTLTLGSSLFVAGQYVSGKMEVECRADKGLGFNLMMVELFAIQELTSRDHSATSTFLHSRRLFQGPGLPPSNAVQPHPLPGDPPLPPNYHHARRGISTFLFRFPLPSSSPSSISFGSGIARVRYEIKASVQVAWKGEIRLVTDKKEVDVVESYEEDFGRVEPEGVIVGENGKIWVQGKVVGGLLVAGESACVELQVKNHSSKKNTGLTITLSRELHLPGVESGQKPPLQLSDTLIAVPYRGPEYIVHPGAEGIASLVFDIPKYARGVKGGTRDGDEEEDRISEPLFEVRCIVGIKLNMGITSKDINLDLPVTIVHPAALPELPNPGPYTDVSGYPQPNQQVFASSSSTVDPVPYAYPVLPMSPPIPAYIDQNQVWLPPPVSHTPQPYHYMSPPILGQQYYFPSPTAPTYGVPPRPPSAGPSSVPTSSAEGLPDSSLQNPILLPLQPVPQQFAEREEGKGQRASRISKHLRLSSRHRSVSPQSHRFPLPPSPNHHAPEHLDANTLPLPQSVPVAGLELTLPDTNAVLHSPRPMPSPKQTYTTDPFSHQTLSKSERVEALERIAAKVDEESKDMSADIPLPILNQDPELTIAEKSLPKPPDKATNEPFSPPASSEPQLQPYTPAILLAPPHKTPPTPTLTAITPARRPKTDLLSPSGPTESGLDALERRLLAEVGTRKLETYKRPDVRTVLPIDIPPVTNPEPLNDSAISSLSLADHIDHDSDGRTHMPAKSSMSGDDKDVHERGKDSGKAGSSKTTKDVERKKKKKDGESRNMRKSAQGRVAAWLGGIDPNAPPPDESLPEPPLAKPTPDILPSPETNKVSSTPIAEQAEAVPVKDVSSSPNPRSSGFVPIGTFKREPFQRYPTAKAGLVNVAAEEAKTVTELWSATPPPITLSPSPAKTPQSSKNNGLVSPPTASHRAEIHAKIPLSQASRSPPASKSPLSVAALKKPSLNLPVFPPQRINPEVKYDIRSARGGRGGKVTAVAAIWASGAFDGSKPKESSPPPRTKKPAPRPLAKPAVLRLANQKSSPTSSDGTLTPTSEPKLAGKPARPIVKSTSVPAMVSSSVAVPTLSSTASLARPSSTPNNPRSPIKLPPTIAEASELGNLSTPIVKPPTKGIPSGELAFGQARLRDLIKKYQGQAS